MAHINPITGKTYSSADYKLSAELNLLMARMERMRGNLEARDAHLSLGGMYIRSAASAAAKEGK